MDITKLLSDFKINSSITGTDHNWVNLQCPHCGDNGQHLGIHLVTNGTHCWKCGTHPLIDTIAALLHIDGAQARQIIEQYGGWSGETIKPPPAALPKPQIIDIKLPEGSEPLARVPGAIRYIRGRGFDPDMLESEWGVVATGPLAITTYMREGKERTLDLSYRIVVPIHFEGKLISWQCRDWTKKAKLPYITCPPELEARHHKSILYGWDKATGNEAVLVEGAWDAWGVGPGTLASFGIEYRPEQVRLLAKFDMVTLLYDPEPRAQLQAMKIAAELRQYGTRLRRINTRSGRDPAETSREELRELLCQMNQ